MTTIDLSTFQSSLTATVEWCRSRFMAHRPADSLRSDELKPEIMIASTDDLKAINDVVDRVVGRRAVILGTPRPDPLRLDGRLFAFLPLLTLFDGVSEDETEGFIDETNTPPWDTWVTMIDDVLISWIPPSMIQRVQSAIVCNAEECIAWLSDLQRPFVNDLRQNQLVL